MVLILDDIPGVIAAFGLALRRMDVEFVGVGTLAEARRCLPRNTWAAFILDLELPDGSGLDLLEELRSLPEYRRTPTTVITANVMIDESTLRRIDLAGASLHCGVFGSSETAEICRWLLGRDAGRTP